MTRLPAAPEREALTIDQARPALAGNAFDEVFDPEGHPRTHWKALLDSLARLGTEEFAARAENGRRILREHGALSGRAEEGDTSGWSLDFLPLVISAREWRQLSQGLIQRARLLNAILHDLYSVQRLVRDGFIPAPLVFANPGYLRACQALSVPGSMHLHLYAADLGRGPDGAWRVLADRTQAPTGLGFAQEARAVIARVLPEALQEVRPGWLRHPWRIPHEAFRRLAPRLCDQPNVVVLTPGPRNEAYFEDTYLGRSLGITVVEGEDLSVRDRCVFIKTLNGLRRVDVILRRVRDSFCDPLELRDDSLLGVPGLVEAARAGQVSIINPLGSGLLESPAYLPFLPALCRHLLDEELQLPSVPTWWCGERGGSTSVRERAGDLVLRRAFGFGTESAAPDQMLARPHEWVGQEPIRLSHLPVWAGGRWQSRPVVLRLLAIFDGESFAVVSGGLARTMTQTEEASFPLSLGGLCKDVWIADETSPGPEAVLHTPAFLTPHLERSPADLPSRLADNFFWLGRYAERLEHLARTARGAVDRLSDETGAARSTRLPVLARLLANVGIEDLRTESALTIQALQDRILLVLYSPQQPGGVRDLVGRIRGGAFSVRHRLSIDTSAILSRLGAAALQRPSYLPLLHASALLNGLIVDLAALSGMQMENVTRGHGWVFLDLGRRVERALNLGRLLELVVVHAADIELLFEPALEIADSVMTYRWRYFGLPRLDGVIDLLLAEPLNPRSLRFQMARIQEHAQQLPSAVNPEGVKEAQRRVAALAEQLQGLEPGVLSDPEKQTAALALLGRVSSGISDLSEWLTQVYFSHVQARLA